MDYIPAGAGLDYTAAAGSSHVEFEAEGEEVINVASVTISVQIIMLGFTFLIGHVLRRRKIMVIHEAGSALALGVLVGLIVKLTGHEHAFRKWLNFNESFFFYFLLPPIMFESGWSLRTKPFFRNFGAICAFTLLGTFLSIFGVGILMYMFGRFHWTDSMPFLVCLAYGSLISATDPVTVLAIFHELGVDPNLYAYVFGESALNDAVAIVMYKTVLSFIKPTADSGGVFGALSSFIVILIGSFSIGVLTAMLSALLFKRCHLQEKGLAVLESCLTALFPYLAYNLADALGLSGIVAILFAGITMKYYTASNLSPEAQEMASGFFEMLAKLSETFVFIYIGVALFIEKQSWHHMGFTFFTITWMWIGRALNVYPCAALVNYFREPSRHIPMNHQHALWYSGLRGAMAFALALQSATDLPQQHGRVLLTSTLFTVFFTVIVIGGFTSYFLKFLDIECHGPGYEGEDDDADMEHLTNAIQSEEIQDLDELGNGPEAKGLRALMAKKATLRKKLLQLKAQTSFHSIDEKYLKPFFLAQSAGATPQQLKEMEQNLATLSKIREHEIELEKVKELEQNERRRLSSISMMGQQMERRSLLSESSQSI